MTTDEIEQIKATIAALEGQRVVLGDAVVETALAPLREKLAALTRAAAPADERKRVTVLFADVSGYTALSEKLDPEDVTAIMNRLFDRLTAEITHFGGTVDKFSGDSVMALFGALRALENHEEMAVRAALGMQETVAAFSADLEQEQGFGLRMRIGLNTGEVLAGWVGGGGSRSYTVMGDTVNLASRLEHACPVGQVLVSAETARRLPAIFDFEPPQQITVKGKSEPVTVYVVIGGKAQRGRVRGVTGLYAPMVGREEELAVLQAAFRQALSERCWQVVAVIGEAGIGKTRLRREFMSWAAQSWPATRLLTGRCYAHTQATPYALVADLVRALFDIGSDASTASATEQLVAGLRRLDPAVEEVEFGYRLGSLTGVLGFSLLDDPLQQLDPEQRRDRTFLSLEQVLLAASAASALLIVVEDLHWADTLSLSFIARLVEMAGRGLICDRAGLLMIISRPAEDPAAALARWLEQIARPPAHTLALSPLDMEQSSALVAQLLAQAAVPADFSSLIVRRAQGNPFFVEEILRSLIEDGTLVHDPAGGGWRVTRSVSEVQVPETVQGVLAARLDRLPADDKRVIRYAAVVGRRFWQQLLADVAAGGSDRGVMVAVVAEALSRLEERQLVQRRGLSPIAEDWEWVFRHVLTQEVAYAGVPKAVRRSVHCQVARWLESRLGDQAGSFIPLIAYHYERGDVPEKALEYLGKAGEQAAAQFANSDAVDYFSRALALLERVERGPAWTREQRYALLLGREAAYALIGEREAQAADLEQLATLADELGDARRRAEVYLCRTNYCDAISDFPAALAAAQEVVGWARQAGDLRQEIAGHVAWARALWPQGKFEEARQRLAEALTLARHCGDRAGESTCLHHLGTISFFLGEYAEARDCLEQSLAIRRALGDRRGEAASLNNLAGVDHSLGDFARALVYNEQTLAIYQAIGDRRNETHALSNLGNIYQALGELTMARDHQQRALVLFRLIGDRRGEAMATENMGLIYHDLGDDREACSHCEQALEIERAIGDQEGEVFALAYLALAREGLGEWAAAAAAYERALQLRRTAGQAAYVDDLAGLSRVSLQQGQVGQALSYIEEALTWIDAHGLDGIEYPLRVYLTSVDVLDAAGQADRAARNLAKAHDLLLERASRISDDATRQTFLERVPLHRQVRERFARQRTEN